MILKNASSSAVSQMLGLDSRKTSFMLLLMLCVGDSMRGRFAIIASSCLSILAGCTHLEVSKVEDDAAPPSGPAYMLDFTQYQVVLTRRLSKCTPGEMPVITADATVTPQLAPDGDQLYVIAYASMISAFKTSDVSAEFKEGRLVGFNASTVDKTGEVLTSVITTAGKVAMMAAVPMPMAGGTQFCTDAAVAKLQLIENSKDPIADATSNIEEGQGRLSTLTAQYAAKPTETLRRRIKKLTGDLKTARDALDKQTKAVTAAQAWLTDTTTITWPDTSKKFHSGPGTFLGPAVVEKWFRVAEMRTSLSSAATISPKLDRNDALVIGGYDGTAERLGLKEAEFTARYPDLPAGTKYSNCKSVPTCLAAWNEMTSALIEREIDRSARAGISMHIVRRGSYGSEHALKTNDDRKAGLRYRVPAAGTFYVCKFDDPCQTGTGTPISKTDSAVAQLGRVFNLPFSSPAFASGSMSAKFDDQGRLASAGLKRDSSTALGMANVAAAAADQGSALLKGIDGAEITKANNATKLAQAIKARDDAVAANTKTPQQLANEQLALLKTEQEIASLSPDRARELTKEIEVGKLELELAELNKKRDGDPNAGDGLIAAQYDAQTLVLNSRRARAEAELTTLRAERTLAQEKAQ